MQLKRTISKWSGLLFLASLLWTGCKEKPQAPETAQPPEQVPEQVPEQTTTGEPAPDNKAPEMRPPSVSPVKPWAGQSILKIYYDREPLAPEWIKRWTAGAQYKIEQVKLNSTDHKALPTDGDLYMVSPPLVSRLRSILEWSQPQSLFPLEQIKPLYTGHGFDPDNQVSLPWRWSPYVFYRKRTNPEQALPAFTFSGWTADEHAAWPNDWALLWAMKRHLTQGSANAPVADSEIGSIKSLKEQLAGHVLPEAECWKNFNEGKIKTTFALAAWRLKPGATADPLVEWAVPHQGTLIQFDQLMVPAKSPYLAAVSELVKLLLSSEFQNELTAGSGYFPVRLGSNLPAGSPGIKLLESPWMDNSEFLILDLNALIAESTSPTPSPSATPSVSPSPSPSPTISPTPKP